MKSINSTIRDEIPVTCPECGVETDIDNKLVSGAVWERTTRKRKKSQLIGVKR